MEKRLKKNVLQVEKCCYVEKRSQERKIRKNVKSWKKKHKNCEKMLKNREILKFRKILQQSKYVEKGRWIPK